MIVKAPRAQPEAFVRDPLRRRDGPPSAIAREEHSESEQRGGGEVYPYGYGSDVNTQPRASEPSPKTAPIRQPETRPAGWQEEDRHAPLYDDSPQRRPKQGRAVLGGVQSRQALDVFFFPYLIKVVATPTGTTDDAPRRARTGFSTRQRSVPTHDVHAAVDQSARCRGPCEGTVGFVWAARCGAYQRLGHVFPLVERRSVPLYRSSGTRSAHRAAG